MTGTNMASSRARRWSGWGVALSWLLAFSPAILVLILIVPRRVPVPYHDSWAFVKQYQNWCEGHYGWREFFAPHNNHPSAVGKAVYFAVLEWCRGDVGLLPLVTWALALTMALCVLGLSRPIWRGRPLLGAGLMFLSNLSIFTLAQGHTWIWDFVFQNAIPGTCLMVGLWALSASPPPGWRWMLAAGSALVAAFSFGTGPAVGFLLLPALWFALENKKPAARVPRAALWAAGAGLAGWMALAFFVPPGATVGPADNTGRLGDLLDRPADTVTYVLILLGHPLGQGTSLEPVTLCAFSGAIVLLVFLACSGAAILRRDTALLRESWPWIAMGLWTLMNAAAICYGRFRATVDTALAPRYGAFMMFLPCGATLLAAWLTVRAGDHRLGRWLRRAAAPAAAVMVVLHLLAWHAGWKSLDLHHRRMAGEKAMLTFTDALPPLREDIQWQLDYSDGTARVARFLHQQGRLRGVQFVPDAALSRWHRSADAPEKWAHWELLRRGDGGALMQGVCGLSKNLLAMPDLVLITAATPDAPEMIIALAPPLLPDDFLDQALRRRVHYEHYFGWRWPVDPSRLPQGGEVTLRAYGLDHDGRRVRKIPGEGKLPPASP